MRFGVHLPLADLGDGVPTSALLRRYTATAAALGYVTLSANDHLLWRRPWLDGPTALTSVLEHAGSMTLATSVALPTVRHPVALGKWLSTLGCLTDAPVIGGIGPGSSRADHDAVGVPFDERWARFDDALALTRALVRGEPPPASRFYPLPGDLRLDPLPRRAPEVWCGSWGSARRLRPMARVADGWLASGYNTTPERFREARDRLDGHLVANGRDPATFPDLVATMWLYVTDDRREAHRLLHEVLAPTLRRDPDELAAQLPIGSPEHCIRLLQDYEQAGAQQILLWPVADPVGQLHAFAEQVRGHVPA